MVFKAFDGDGFFDSIGMFGKSFKQINIDSKFKKYFNELIASGITNEDARYAALERIGISAQKVTPALLEAAQAADQTGIKMRVLGDTSKLAAAGMQILASVANMAFAAFASWAIGKAIQGIEYLVNYADHMAENLSASKSKVEENETAIENYNKELENTRKLMSDLEKLGKANWSPIEQEEYELLKKQNDELERKLAVEQALLRVNQRQKEADYLKAFDSRVNSAKGMGPYNPLSAVGSREEFTSDLSEYGVSASFVQDIVDSFVSMSGGNFVSSSISAAGMFELNKQTFADNLKTIQDYQQEVFSIRDKIQEKQKQDPNGLNASIQADIKALDEELIKYEDKITAIETKNTELQGSMASYLKDLQTDAEGFSYIEGPNLTTAEKQINDQLKYTEYVAETFAELENVVRAENDFATVLNADIFSEQATQLRELAAAGQLTADVLTTQFAQMFAEWERLGWTADQVVNKIVNDVGGVHASTSPSPTSYDQVTASAWRATEAYTALTEAMEAQNEAGYLSAEAYHALIEADAEYIELLELTAEGYKINEEALWKYIEAQDDLEKGKAIKAMMELQDAMLKTEDVQEKMAYQSQIDNLSAYINQLDRATGALARFRAAQETPNQDEEFGEGQKAFDVIKEGRKTGKVGTDDFKESVGLMLGDNWETEYAGQLDKAYKKAEQIGKRYFGQKDERHGMANFRDDLVKANLGEFDGKTFTLFEGVTLEETAKQLGTSVDAVRSMFGLMQAYGGDFEFPFVLSNEDIKNMEAYVKTLDKAELAASETQLQTSLDEQKQELASLEDPVQIQIKQDDIAQTEQALSLVQDRIDELDSGEETDLSSLSFVELVDYAKKLEDAITTMNELGIEIPASITGDVELLEGLIELKGLSEREAKIRIESGTPIDKVAEGTTVDGVDESFLTNAIRNTGKAAIQNENGSYNYANPMEYIGNIISQIESANRPVDFETVFAKYTADQKAGLVEIDESFLTVGQLISAALEKRNEKESESVEVSMDTNIEEVKDEFGEVEIDVSATDSSIEGIVSEVDEQLMGESVGVEVTPEVTTIPESEINTEGTIDINGDVTSAEATLNEFELEAAKEIAKKMGLDPSNAETALASLEAKLKKSVTKTVYVNTVGEANASGTDSAAGGMSLVDERGAELIEHTSRGTYELGTNSGPRFTNLDPGDVVHTASETKKIMSRMAKVGGFFRDGLNKGKAIIGKAFATGVSGSMSWDLINQVFSSSSGSSKKNSSSSKSSTKTKNWKTYVEKLFDWIEIRLDRLQTQTDKWILAASEAIGYVAKNSELDKALSSTSQQIDETTQAYQRYLEQAQTIASKAKLSAGIVQSIQEGTIDIASYDKTTQEKIKAYQEWWITPPYMVTCMKNLFNCWKTFRAMFTTA